MPSVRYYNQTAPFWDFVASLEDQGAQHPLFGGRPDNDNEDPHQSAPWPFGRVPHRGRHGPHGPHGHHGHHGPPGPPPPPADDADVDPPTSVPPPGPEQDEAGPSEPRGPHPHHWGRGTRGEPWNHRGGCNGRGARSFPFAQGGPAPFWADIIRNFTGDFATENKSEDFKPEADVFDTPDNFVVHVSLPGAKKEDVGVSWDADKSEVNVAGVIYRPGDEDFLKTLALNERNIGAFERKIRLGSRANPAQVDSDAITAKMEDGVLTIEIPKLDSGYVEVKKVDIE